MIGQGLFVALAKALEKPRRALDVGKEQCDGSCGKVGHAPELRWVLCALPRRQENGARTVSIRSSASGGSSIPLAATFSSTCSGREAPTIALETPGSRSTQAMASCAI